MKAYVFSRLSWWFERFSPAVAVLAVAAGALVLIGWTFDMVVLKSILSGLTAMNVNTACGFILAGIALWASQSGVPNHYSRIAPFCAGLVLALGLLSLGEHLSDIPGRMAMTSAVNFVALGAALLLIALTKKDLVWAVHGLATLVILTSAITLIGYAYDIEDFLRARLAYTPMTLHTSAFFVLLGLGIVNTRPDHAFRYFMTSDCVACKLVRRLLPTTIGFTFVSGWLVLQGYKYGYYSEITGLVLFVVGLWTLILRNEYILYEADTRRNQAEQELQSASQYTRSLIEASLDPLVTISPEGKITDVNEATVLATGVPRHLLVGSDFSDYFTEPDKARAGYLKVFAKGMVTDYPLALKHVSGRIMDVLYNASVYRNEKAEVAGIFAAARDITERKRDEEEMRAASLYARNLIEASLDPMMTISPEGKITDVNEATVLATGVQRKLLVGSDFTGYFTEPDKARTGYQEVFARGFVTDYQLALRHVSGRVTDVLYNASIYRNAKGEVTGIFAAARDITARMQAERDLHKYQEHLEELVRERTSELERLASTDPLTGIANRRSFLQMAGLELERSRRFGHPPSLLMLDIDYFKAVNDRHGHAAGDQILVQFAQVVVHTIRDVDVLGRLGGEEFAVLLPETDIALATQVAERVRSSIEATSTEVEQGEVVRFTISIGVATLCSENENIDVLLRRADQALYEAKQSGRNKVCVNSRLAKTAHKQG